jgi:hypothetical protein
MGCVLCFEFLTHAVVGRREKIRQLADLFAQTTQSLRKCVVVCFEWAKRSEKYEIWLWFKSF